MWLKIFILMVFMLSNEMVFSQKTDTLVTDCIKNKPVPFGGDYDFISKIDTLKSSEFKILIKSLHDKMSLGVKMSDFEYITLLKVENTLIWMLLDNQKDILFKFPLLSEISRLFKDKYERVLYCEFSTFLGTGLSLYYKELRMNVGGKPFDCSRYYIIKS